MYASNNPITYDETIDNDYSGGNIKSKYLLTLNKNM